MGETSANRPLLLVVDDDRETRRAIAAALREELGAEVEEAEDGEDARYALIEMERPPDAIVVDARMPFPDGPELVRRLRTETATRRLPVLGMSAWVTAETMFEAGCDAFLAKPFDLDELAEAVRRLLPGTAPAA